MRDQASCRMVSSWRPFAGALLVGLLGSMPAFARTDTAPRPSSSATKEPVQILNDWEYTSGNNGTSNNNGSNNNNSNNNNSNNNGSNNNGSQGSIKLSQNQLITDIVTLVVWVNLNVGNKNVSAMVFDVLLLEYVYDLSVLGTLSQAQLDALVFGEFFINTHFIIPQHSTTTTGGGRMGNGAIASRIRTAIRKRLGIK